VLAALLSVGTLSQPARAHGPNQIIQETFVFIDASMVTIEYHTTYGAILARVKLISADTDGDGSLSAAEKSTFLESSSAGILSKLQVSIDGAAVEMRYAEGRLVAPPLRRLADTATVLLRFEGVVSGNAGPLDGSARLLRVVDRNFSAAILGHMVFYVRPGPRTRNLDVSQDSRTLEWTFLPSPRPAQAPGHQGTAELHATRHGADDWWDEGGTLSGFIQRGELSFGFLLIALAVAAGLGAVHALSPGHGKAMVAAYLIGSKGRIRDAILLGGVVTFTHVISVVILGALALALTGYVAPEELYPWLGFASGCLVFVIGYWLVASRALGLGHSHSHAHIHTAHSPANAVGESHEHHHNHEHGDSHGHERSNVNDHEHGHSHDHEHSHEHSHVPTGQVTLWSLLSLGISGGMVPCPSALVVLLAAVAMHRIAFGLILILAFSVGLAAVLILIGVLAVTATRFMTRAAGEGRWVRALPVVSAGVIMLVGILLAFTSLLTGGVLKAGF